MRLLVSGATRTIRELLDKRHLGHLLTPAAGNGTPNTGLPWACDNSAYHDWDPAAFCRMLGKIAGVPGCLFVACPDVVGDAFATADLFRFWQPVIKSLGLPVALVLQDGQDRVGVPWSMVDALFIGGSTAFKLGPVAAKLAREGKRRGLWVHGGRINTRRRFRHMFDVGCDSVDGSGFSTWPSRIALAVEWLDELERQPTLGLAV